MASTAVAALLVGLGSFWFSLMGLFVKEADAVALTTPFLLLAVRSALGLLLNFPATVASCCVAERRSLATRDTLWLCVRVVAGIGSVWCEYKALQRLPLGTSTMIVYSSPAFVVLWSFALFREPIEASVLGCLLLAFLGLALIARPWLDDGCPLWAYGLSLLAAALAGLVYVALRELRHVKTHVVLNAFLGASAVFAWLAGAALDALPLSSKAQAWLWLAAVGVAAYAAEVCVTRGFASAGPQASRVAVLKFLTPALSLVWGVAFLGEGLALLDILGACCVLLASAGIVCLMQRQQQSKAEATLLERS